MSTARTPHGSWPIRRLPVLAGAMLLGLAALTAQGQAPQTRKDPANAMDADGDGRISAREHAAAAAAMFARMDADRDGQLAASEMAGHRAMMRVAPRGAGAAMGHGAGRAMPGMHASGTGMHGQMQMHDGNGDGVITAEEHAAAAKARFDRIDADHDGRVTAAEWAAAHPMMGAGEPGMGMGAGGTRGMPMAAQRRIAAMDSDADGSVSAAEHARHAATMFESMDIDRDGYLAGDEIARHRALMMGVQGMPPGKVPADPPETE